MFSLCDFNGVKEKGRGGWWNRNMFGLKEERRGNIFQLKGCLF